jgi:hypothetical protein
MGGYGQLLAEEGHVVNALPPVDINGAANSDIFALEKYEHATIVIQLGVTGAASTVTVEECDTIVPANNTAIAFSYYAEATDAGDTLAARAAATTAGFATSTNDNVMYVIEIDADQLSEGYPYLRVVFSDPGASTIASVVAILTGGIKKGITPTAIT